jgi:hypothetical protein
VKDDKVQSKHLQFDALGVYCDHASAEFDTNGEIVNLKPKSANELEFAYMNKCGMILLGCQFAKKVKGVIQEG